MIKIRFKKVDNNADALNNDSEQLFEVTRGSFFKGVTLITVIPVLITLLTFLFISWPDSKEERIRRNNEFQYSLLKKVLALPTNDERIKGLELFIAGGLILDEKGALSNYLEKDDVKIPFFEPLYDELGVGETEPSLPSLEEKKEE